MMKAIQAVHCNTATLSQLHFAVARMRQPVRLVSLCSLFLMSVGGVSAQADIAAGEQAFGQCAGCHAIGPNAAHRFGPQLNGIVERGAGAAEGYDYSPAFAAKVADGLD